MNDGIETKRDRTEAHRREVALFRYGVIADLLHAPPGADARQARLRKKEKLRYRIPGSRRTRVSAGTMCDWLRAYRRGGFDALMPKRRSDAGQPRRMSADMIEALLAEKRECPTITVKAAIAKVRERLALDAQVPMPPSTVHRLFAREGLMQPVAPAPADRRRFSYPHAGDLWMSDVMHGPGVRCDGRRRRAYLIGFLDDATRVVPYAEFALSESASAFGPVFKQALQRRGVPRRLYVDNGAAYRSQFLSVVCARLNIALIHARPFQPAGKGKIERFHRTCRSQLINHLGAADTESLGSLNEKLWAWIEGEYHYSPHRGLDGLTPLDRWAKCAQQVRLIGPETDLDNLFLFETRRKVMNDRTIRLHNRIYEADAALIGQSVTVRYDPQASPRQPVEVVFDGRKSQAQPVDVHANARRRQQPTQAPPISFTHYREDR